MGSGKHDPTECSCFNKEVPSSCPDAGGRLSKANDADRPAITAWVSCHGVPPGFTNPV